MQLSMKELKVDLEMSIFISHYIKSQSVLSVSNLSWVRDHTSELVKSNTGFYTSTWSGNRVKVQQIYSYTHSGRHTIQMVCKTKERNIWSKLVNTLTKGPTIWKRSYLSCGFDFSEFVKVWNSFQVFHANMKHSTGRQKTNLDCLFLFSFMMSFLSKQTLFVFHTLQCFSSGRTNLNH